jgi:hypothetical protein
MASGTLTKQKIILDVIYQLIMECFGKIMAKDSKQKSVTMIFQ